MTFGSELGFGICALEGVGSVLCLKFGVGCSGSWGERSEETGGEGNGSVPLTMGRTCGSGED